MDEHVIEYDCECGDCDGTGLYVGMGERDGAAVVCYRCKGTGQKHITITYRDFEGRKHHKDVQRVFEVNPGITIGSEPSVGLRLSDFGGMPYQDWKQGLPFPPGSEDRRFTCPAWWYQTADYKKKPNWKDCLGCGSFSGCQFFPTKAMCWARFDREQKGGE